MVYCTKKKYLQNKEIYHDESLALSGLKLRNVKIVK